MTRFVLKFLFAISFFISGIIHAEDVPEIIDSGFKAYEENGPKAAIVAWVKGSSIDGSKEALSQANMFRQIEDYFGEYQGYDLFKSNALGPKSHLYLVTINFKKGALFAKFFTYKPAGEKQITQSFKFHTEVDQVWPSYMVYGE